MAQEHGDSVVEALRLSLAHFVNLDRSNAAIHASAVRYSPLTFRLAEALASLGQEHRADVAEVLDHAGQYEEDRGR